MTDSIEQRSNSIDRDKWMTELAILALLLSINARAQEQVIPDQGHRYCTHELSEIEMPHG